MVYKPPGQPASQVYPLDVSKGLLQDNSFLNRISSNPSVGTTTEDIWADGGQLVWPTEALPLSVVSDDANDTEEGTGAQLVLIQGIDENWAAISETVALNGTTPVQTVNSYLRLNLAFVTRAGSSQTNVGLVEISHDGNNQGRIAIGKGRTTKSHYTIPQGKTAAMWNVWIAPERQANLSIDCFVRISLETENPVKVSLLDIPELDQPFDIEFDQAPVAISAGPTDIWLTAVRSGSGTASVAAGFNLQIYDTPT